MCLDSYLREHHPLLALRLDIETYQRSLPMDTVFQIGNRFLPLRSGFGGCGVAYGKHMVLTEIHLDNSGHNTPYAIVRRGDSNTDRFVVVFKTWWRDVLWLQDPSMDTGWCPKTPIFRDNLERIFDTPTYFDNEV